MSNPTIYYVGSDSARWAEYMKRKLENEYNIPTALCDVSNNVEELKNSTPNILLVSPELADLDSWSVFRDLNPQQSIAVLLNMKEEELTFLCTEYKEFPEILQWQMQVMESTDDSVINLLVSIIGIYEEVLADYPSPCGKGSTVIEVSEPEHELDHGDDVYEVPPPPRKKNGIYKVIQDNEDKRRIYILLDREADSSLNIMTDGCPDKPTTADHIDKSIYRFNLPDNTPDDEPFKFRVFSGTQDLGHGKVKCSSKLEQLRKILSHELSPISLLCQAMGIRRGDLESLDTVMANEMRQWRPLRFMQHFEGPVTPIEGQTKWPTILHFGAQYHLEKFCRELVNFPGMVAACITSNSDGDYPSDIAKREGLQGLAKELECFVREYAAKDESNLQTTHDSGFIDVVQPPPRCTNTSSNYISMDGHEQHPLPPRVCNEKEMQHGYIKMSPFQNISEIPDCQDRYSSGSDSYPDRPRNVGHHHVISGYNSEGDRNSSGSDSNSESPRNSGRHHPVSGHHIIGGNDSMKTNSKKHTSPHSVGSLPLAGHFHSSSVPSSLSSSPVAHHRLFSETSHKGNNEENRDMHMSLSKAQPDISSLEYEAAKAHKNKLIRRSSSSGFAAKMSRFLQKMKPHRKHSLPDLGPSLANFQTYKTKVYNRQCQEEPFSSGNSVFKDNRGDSVESERDSGSYEDSNMSGSRPPSTDSVSSLPREATPIRQPRQQRSIQRQMSVRLNNALKEFNVLAPPLPERRPVEHDTF